MDKKNLFLSEGNTMGSYELNWENSIDQNDPFESIVSSPAASNNGGDNFVLRELIGKLGTICNSGEISYFNSTSNSCYTTPLNSPPKLDLSNFDHQLPNSTNFAHFYGSELGNQQLRKSEFGDSRENSSVSEIGIKCQNDANSKKRKPVSKRKAKETDANVSIENNEFSGKRSKSDEKNKEPAKDYIHVRARRGEATDAHSLAERVRREKISERMKFLQDLVPGCNKITGKAVMLDEIINYVQSLQRQIEFLSMKLANFNPRMEFNMVPKNLFQSGGSLHPETSAQEFPYGYQSQQTQHYMATNVPTFFEDDLHSVIHMGFAGAELQCIEDGQVSPFAGN